ncbi:MAG: hypothetical protein PHS97_07720 [Oscillospiraceae bacterium]|nr:hypothetical protein [Oscillospiraceae bacterium]
MEKYFPLNQTVVRGDVGSFVIALVIYLFAPSIVGIVVALLHWLPLVGWLLGITSSLFSLYCLVGLILVVIKYFKK